MSTLLPLNQQNSTKVPARISNKFNLDTNKMEAQGDSLFFSVLTLFTLWWNRKFFSVTTRHSSGKGKVNIFYVSVFVGEVGSWFMHESSKGQTNIKRSPWGSSRLASFKALLALLFYDLKVFSNSCCHIYLIAYREANGHWNLLLVNVTKNSKLKQ